LKEEFCAVFSCISLGLDTKTKCLCCMFLLLFSLLLLLCFVLSRRLLLLHAGVMARVPSLRLSPVSHFWGHIHPSVRPGVLPLALLGLAAIESEGNSLLLKLFLIAAPHGYVQNVLVLFWPLLACGCLRVTRESYTASNEDEENDSAFV
jgi:hypothetical protein